MKPKDAKKAAQDGFMQSDNNAIGGIELQPLTPQRFIVAQAMGLTWPIPKSAYRKDGGLYKGELADAIITLWLCTLAVDGSAAWTVKRAQREPEEALDAATEWAEQQKISHPQSKEFWAAITTYEKIVLEVTRAYTEPTEGATDPNE